MNQPHTQVRRGTALVTGASSGIGAIYADRLARLGYDRYGVQGGDWGSIISQHVAGHAPDHVTGCHVNMIPAFPPGRDDDHADITPAEQQHLASDRSGHVGVAVTVATHPGGHADRRCPYIQGAASLSADLSVQFTKEPRQGAPQRMFDNSEAPLGFIDRRRPAAADLVGMPGLADQPCQIIAQRCGFATAKIIVVAPGQSGSDSVVLLYQGAAGHLGRVSSQHQLDIERFDMSFQRLAVQTRCAQTLDQLGETGLLEPLGLVRPASSDAMVLLGDVGKIEKLVERAADRQQLIIWQIL